jgi:hypothetical protein
LREEHRPASSEEAIREHADRADLPVDELVKVADTGRSPGVGWTARTSFL